MHTPRFASALSTDPDARVAEQRCLAALLDGLGGATPELVVFFVTHHYGEAIEGLGGRLRRATGAGTVVGCTGTSVLGGRREVEQKPGLTVWAGAMPGTRVRADHIHADRDGDGIWSYTASPDIREPSRASLLLLGDPYSFPMPEYLEFLGQEHPGVPVVGGMASGGSGPGQNLMWVNDELLHFGMVALVIEGEIEVNTAVSQGCRPIGEPVVITRCQDNVILELRGRPAAKVLLEAAERMPESDRQLFRRAAFLGIAVDARKSVFEAGDLLVRNIVHLDLKRHALAVAERRLRVGQTVQFMVRDADSATADLEDLLERHASDWGPATAGGRETGSLLFTCGGRGSRMFPMLHHDVTCLQAAFGPDLPVAGFFANGEIGPVGGQSFLHGQSVSIAMFRPRGETGAGGPG
jgi:small ligand-binding sensory domain FIST